MFGIEQKSMIGMAHTASALIETALQPLFLMGVKMKEITLSELVTDTLHDFFYGGMTAEEHMDEDEKLEDLHVYLARHESERSANPSSKH